MIPPKQSILEPARLITLRLELGWTRWFTAQKNFSSTSSLGVLTEYSKKRLGLKLLGHTLHVLKDLGYPQAFVSSFPIRIAEKLDFQRVSGHTYNDNYPDYQKMPEHVQNDHKECLNMIKLLY